MFPEYLVIGIAVAFLFAITQNVEFFERFLPTEKFCVVYAALIMIAATLFGQVDPDLDHGQTEIKRSTPAKSLQRPPSAPRAPAPTTTAKQAIMAAVN